MNDFPNYVNYETFGQEPSRNWNWNLFMSLSQMPSSPYFCCGLYNQYWCLTDTSLSLIKEWKFK